MSTTQADEPLKPASILITRVDVIGPEYVFVDLAAGEEHLLIAVSCEDFGLALTGRAATPAHLLPARGLVRLDELTRSGTAVHVAISRMSDPVVMRFHVEVDRRILEADFAVADFVGSLTGRRASGKVRRDIIRK